LGEKEEAATFASFVVFLALVGFENLVPVILGIQTLYHLMISYPIYKSYILKYLLSITFHLNIDFNCSKVFLACAETAADGANGFRS
jgi:hypothetical protein